jgi:ubiquinone/menaquinone biosynthesis C-methylase UbiE
MKEFWEEQALKYGDGVAAVNFDPVGEKLAASLLDELVPDHLAVADLGCGNGLTLIALAQSRPGGRFVGYDFAENMVRVAENERRNLGLGNLRFECLDAAAPTLPSDATGAFDLVIGKRVLINIKGDGKRQALKNAYEMLRHGGTYIMVECFFEPLDRINKIRADLDLPPITVRSFNEYLTGAIMPEVERYFSVEKLIDRGSLYYFISRIFNAYLSSGNPDYFAPINQLASKLILSGVCPMQGYSPEVAYVLKKRPVPMAS